ncbi:U3 small nucleolar RNA-associated protein 14 [Klebsormidium nitens]|uniref:U3 small nucleolar RNA-associated protein 14 n=1 Tax=Klebsormidium nitens TaxID=105231 RepID=A0A1Y1IPV5_KLENI|nr:U3 small nucleolar RNA-associated protein 14 [Klebsormidium nitens]|eukprot:GAQ90786.1 U3 small nucleolar RNA-associated protein 14 [Klebsormidium nitens]
MGRKSGGKRQARPQGLPPKAKKQKRDAGGAVCEPISDSEDGAVLPTPYEYEEPMADEELKKNRRYDDVDVYEYELPDDFEDEEIDEDAAFTEEDKVKFGNLFEKDGEEGASEGDSDRDDDDGDIDLNSEDEGSDESEELDPDDFSDEELAGGRDETEALGEEDESEDVGGQDEEGADEGEEYEEAGGRRAGQNEGGEEESDEESDEEELDEERHRKMLEEVMGGARGRESKRRGQVVLSEAVPESEFSLNPGGGTAGGGGRISVADLVGSLDGSAGNLASLRKRLEKVESGAGPVSAPLARALKERVERQAGYEHTKSDVAKWQPLVKANREAPTIVFSADKKGTVAQLSTAGMAAKFVPTTDLEKEISELLKESGAEDGRTVEAGEALELNKLTVEEVLERKERLAKMRSLLFQHESKAKRVKKIKSKAFHRAQAKSRAKERAKNGGEVDREAAREEALKEEFKRAQERMTLEHKNTSKWAKRALKRGLEAHVEDGTREAIAEQLRMHAALTRKVDRMDDKNSSDESSSEDEYDDVTADVADGETAEGLRLARETARDKAAVLRVLDEDPEGDKPRKGLFALPFMARALDRKSQEARDEAMALLDELEHRQDPEATAGNPEDAPRGTTEALPPGTSGRMSFGAAAAGVSRPHASDDEGGDFEGDSDLEGGSQSEGEAKGEAKGEGEGGRRRGGAKRGPAEGRGKVEILEGEGELAQLGLPGGFRTATEGPVSVGGGGVAESIENGGGDVSMEGGGEGGERAHSWLFRSGGAEKSRAEGGVADETISAGATVKKHKRGLNGVEIAGVKGGMNGTQKAGSESLHVDGENSAQIAGSSEVRIGPAEESGAKNANEGSDGLNARPEQNGGVDAVTFLEGGSEDEGEGVPGADLLQTDLSQAELVRRAFAGDDVEADFEARKAEMLDEEVPAIEGPVTLPGWGQWTGVQKKKGLPGWIVKEQKDNEKKRNQAMAKRQDAGRKHVIISEKWDKKAAKYAAEGVPFPFKDREAFERSLRNPLGREYNTDSAHRNLIRPPVIKSTGVIIDPIKYVKPEQKGRAEKPSAGKKGKGNGKDTSRN